MLLPLPNAGYPALALNALVYSQVRERTEGLRQDKNNYFESLILSQLLTLYFPFSDRSFHLIFLVSLFNVSDKVCLVLSNSTPRVVATFKYTSPSFLFFNVTRC
jgi:hypothetical protein